jgi:hypothetical protein
MTVRWRQTVALACRREAGSRDDAALDAQTISNALDIDMDGPCGKTERLLSPEPKRSGKTEPQFHD